MTNPTGQEPAFPVGLKINMADQIIHWESVGLTKLEFISAMAMQGLLSNSTLCRNSAMTCELLAAQAAKNAHALLAELGKEGK